MTTYFPSLYQVNTRVWLHELTGSLNRPATLDDISDAALDEFVQAGFDWIWLLSVWQTGKVGQRISRTNPEWRKEFEETLSDLNDEDISGSGFAIKRYTVHKQLGGNAALARLRSRMKKRGLKLMLDFVPNHTAIDHDWFNEFPDYFIQGDESMLGREPANYIKLRGKKGDAVFAYGRDPYFSGWPDTLQLNHGNPAMQEALIKELIKISAQCDGVRCDMAMLLLPEVFEKTWQIKIKPFWPEAISRVRAVNNGFCLMAEVYWGLEWILLQQGFDYCYDKSLYDRLKEGLAVPVRQHFFAELTYQNKVTRFLENHDEQRVVAQFSPSMHQAAAILTFLSTGMRFFHQGQLEGKEKKVSPHLGRGPAEAVNDEVVEFYHKLLSVLTLPVVRSGEWQLLDCVAAWEGNPTHDNYICFSWSSGETEKMIVAVNYAHHQGQCFVRLPFDDLHDKQWLLKDLMTDTTYHRDGSELQTKGLYLDEPGWKYYVFIVEPAP